MPRFVLLLALLVVVCAVARGASPTYAATFNVTNNTDCAVLNCGSLRDAITQANATPGPDTINIAPLNATLTLLSNLPPITEALTIAGPGETAFSIQAPCPGCRAFQFSAPVTASGFRITAANREAILIDAPGNYSLSNMEIRGASAGGITSSAIDIQSTTATVNMMTMAMTANLSPTLGYTIRNIGTLVVERVDFTSNNGGIITASTATTTVREVAFVNNQRTAGNGGAISNSGGLTVERALFMSNVAPSGGAIHNSFGGVATISNSTFYQNLGNAGGGGAIFNDQVGQVTLLNATLTGNGSGPSGGGIRNATGANPRVFLRNTIVATNQNQDCGTGGGTVPITSLGNNLFGSNTCGVGVAGDLVNVAPGFVSGIPSPNGGLTPTVALTETSPAIDAGSNAAASCAAGLTDQRGTGFPRVLDGNGDATATCDIGAFELQVSADLLLTKTLVTVGTVMPGGTVQFDLVVRNNGPNTARSLTITDALPAGLTFVSLTPSTGPTFTTLLPGVGQGFGTSVFIQIPELLNGGSLAFSLTMAVSPTSGPGQIQNTASMTTGTSDPVLANNTSTATVNVALATATPTATPTQTATPTAIPTATPTVTPVPLIPRPPAPIPQVFQNPGALAAVGSRPASTPPPRAAVAPAVLSAASPLAPVITPPHTGDAGLKTDRD